MQILNVFADIAFIIDVIGVTILNVMDLYQDLVKV